MDKISM